MNFYLLQTLDDSKTGTDHIILYVKINTTLFIRNFTLYQEYSVLTESGKGYDEISID